jgi:hypothetical protein
MHDIHAQIKFVNKVVGHHVAKTSNETNVEIVVDAIPVTLKRNDWDLRIFDVLVK